MTIGIYAITNKINGKRYVGQSIRIEYRWRQHITGNGANAPLLRAALCKYGVENFEFTILKKCSILSLNKWEQKFIDEKSEYNLARDAVSPFRGRKMTQEHSDKLHGANIGNTYTLGRKMDDQQKQELADRMKGNTYRRGKTMSAEAKDKISNALIGNTYALGYKHTEEAKAKMREAAERKRKHNYGN